MKIQIGYQKNNGYSCACCGAWWVDTEIIELPDNTNLEKYIMEEDKKLFKEFMESGRTCEIYGIDSLAVLKEVVLTKRKFTQTGEILPKHFYDRG